jgi:hypothetical protein
VSDVRAIGSRRTNAELIADCHTLGYLRDTDRVLDATYGLGRFWSIWRPEGLVTNDLFTEADHHLDFTDLSAWSHRPFDVVVFDPPYKLSGTSSQGGPANSDADYGVLSAMPWQDRHDWIRLGIGECAAAARRMLLIKCQDQVCSGQVRWQTMEFADEAAIHGFRLVDMLHVGGMRSQPSNRRQVHARRDYSTLLVTERVKR